MKAICKLSNSKDDTISGFATFTATSSGIEIHVDIVCPDETLLKEGSHGFHIHEFGDMRNGCTSSGGHYNPTKCSHGARDSKSRHVGDLGNVSAVKSADGTVCINETFTDKVISLDGKNSILGRTLVLHNDCDDLGKGGFEDSLTTGHAGARIACGIIGLCKD